MYENKGMDIMIHGDIHRLTKDFIVLGELSDASEAEIQQHLHSCPDCQGTAEKVQSPDGQMMQELIHPSPFELFFYAHPECAKDKELAEEDRFVIRNHLLKCAQCRSINEMAAEIDQDRQPVTTVIRNIGFDGPRHCRVISAGGKSFANNSYDLELAAQESDAPGWPLIQELDRERPVKFSLNCFAFDLIVENMSDRDDSVLLIEVKSLDRIVKLHRRAKQSLGNLATFRLTAQSTKDEILKALDQAGFSVQMSDENK